MSKFAIIATGGKQYKVQPGQTLQVEKLPFDSSTDVQLDTLLLVDDQTNDIQVGRPLLEQTVTAKVIEHGKRDKITVVKYKNKTRYKRTLGHRQPFTRLEIQAW